MRLVGFEHGLPVLEPSHHDEGRVDDRDGEGNLTVVSGVSLEDHLARLDRIRADFLRLVAPLDADALARSRFLPDSNYEISPAWTLHHLMQHEAEHRGQILAIRTLQGV